MPLDNLPTENLDPWYVTWDLGGGTLDQVREYAEEVRFPAGATIFSAGDPSDAMYLVLEGMVIVLMQDESGKEQTVSIITEGQSFGEVGLLINQTRLATTAAGLDVRLLKLSAETLTKLEKERPELIIGLYKKLAQTLAEQWTLSQFEEHKSPVKEEPPIEMQGESDTEKWILAQFNEYVKEEG